MEIAFLGLVVLAASCLQGAIGFGLGLLAAPIIALVRPDLVPATLIMLTLVLSLGMWARERSAVNWRIVVWALIGRVPGVVVGTMAVAMLPSAGLKLVLALTVVGGVTASLVGWSPSPTNRNVAIAGTASGVFGTSTSIGGPPIALVMRAMDPAEVRATINAYFTLGISMSITSLTLVGAVTTEHVFASLWLAPFMVAGLLLSTFLNRWVDKRVLFIGGVSASMVGAVIVIIQAVAALI